MIFFNSSMPRSGSSLLQNVLAQNPDIAVTPTDGSLELLYGARMNYTSCPEFKAQDAARMRVAWLAFCRGGLTAYADALRGKREHICIKSRGIGVHYAWYSAFLGEPPKVLCMVRDIRAIVASMEKLYRQSQEKHQSIQSHAQMKGTTTFKRVQDWLGSQPVGLALERFGQMRLEGTDRKCLVVRYEDFCGSPQKSLDAVYEYLGLPAFKHDPSRVEQITQEDDEVYGLTPTLHKTRSVISLLLPDYKEVLGADICRWINERCADYQGAYGYA